MLSAEEIRNITFSNSMKGYKKEEVDILLDKIESDYEQFARQLRVMQEKNSELAKQLAENNSSKESIQNVLLSAQKLADQIIDDAKNKSEEILRESQVELENYKINKQQMMDAIDKEYHEKKAAHEKAVALLETELAAKRTAMEAAATQSIEKQQAVFDRLKIEASAFKSDMLKRSKAFVLSLNELPDHVPMDAQRAAAAIAVEFENKLQKAQQETEETVPAQISMDEQQEQEETKITAEENTLL